MLLPCVAGAFDSYRSSSKLSAALLIWAAAAAKADMLLDADKICRNESRERRAAQHEHDVGGPRRGLS